MRDRGTFFALVGTLVGIVALASLPSLLAPKPLKPPVRAPQKPLEAPTASETGLATPGPPEPVERLLGAYTSLFKTQEKDARVHNISLGAEKLDGSVLEPGQEWSFNATVGPRTKERGFQDAPTLLMGEVLPGLGGGMCQVSSTVHAVALKSGLDIVKRHPHSRPSSYIPRGLDAMVNYPEHCWEGRQDSNTCFDLVLRNPYDFPITIKTLVHDPVKPTEVPKKALTVELRGIGPVARLVTMEWKLYATPPFKQRKRRGWRPGDWAKKKQTGQNGVNGALVLDFKWPDGRTEQKVYYSRYKPVDEVWWVGDDWDPDKNPWE
jgi:hypothetical protein